MLSVWGGAVRVLGAWCRSGCCCGVVWPSRGLNARCRRPEECVVLRKRPLAFQARCSLWSQCLLFSQWVQCLVFSHWVQCLVSRACHVLRKCSVGVQPSLRSGA